MAPAVVPGGTVEFVVVEDVPSAFAGAVIEAFRTREENSFSLVLSGGPTARRCYEQLARLGSGAIAWNRTDVLVGDERCVAPDDPDSNQRMIRESLLEHVPPLHAFHPMSCDQGPESYDKIAGSYPSFDIVHLGLGPDGHTASLFPGSAALHPPAGSLVVRNSDPAGRNPHERLTLTLEAIARARLVLFTVSGPTKRKALSMVRSGQDVPASRVVAQSVVWLMDREAAGS